MDPQLTTNETAQNNNILSDEQLLLAKKKKKEEKQRVKEEERREFWKKKRQMEKAKKKQSRKRKIEELKEQGIDPTTQLKKRRRKNEITFDPQRIAIDCNFEELMSDKDIRKLANQLRNGYGSNMRLEHPLTLHFTSFKGTILTRVAPIDFLFRQSRGECREQRGLGALGSDAHRRAMVAGVGRRVRGVPDRRGRVRVGGAGPAVRVRDWRPGRPQPAQGPHAPPGTRARRADHAPAHRQVSHPRLAQGAHRQPGYVPDAV